jgi:lauroyl/myristoyl acyltransferase
MRNAIWRIVRALHHWDFALLLPRIASLPLGMGYRLAAFRGWINAWTGRDWRSVGLGFRHVRAQTLEGLALLPVASTVQQRQSWCRERFATEAREEFEGQLLIRRRLHELSVTLEGADVIGRITARDSQRGLVLLTPHFDSFLLGIAFLGQLGARISPVSSAVTKDPRVDAAVQQHFTEKYAALSSYLNGGHVLDMEAGLRPFYRWLTLGNVVLVLADAPVLPQGADMTVEFLGTRRRLAGGPMRLASRTGSDIGAFVCHYVAAGRYRLEMAPVMPAADASIEAIYAFLGKAILSSPGRWWASDLLPAMHPVKTQDAPGRGSAAD